MLKRAFAPLAFIIVAVGVIHGVKAQTEQTFDKRIVPGTRWAASVTMDRGEYVSCQIEVETNDAQVKYAFGSKGSLVILLFDKNMEAQVSGLLGWTEGQSYRSVLMLDDKSFNISAQRIWQHTLLVPLAGIDKKTVFRTKRMALGVGGIAMRSYDVEGLDIASRVLLDCYQQHGRGQAPGGWIDRIGDWWIEYQPGQSEDHCYVRRQFPNGYAIRFTWHYSAGRQPWRTFVVAPSPGERSKYTLRLDPHPGKRHYTLTMQDTWNADGSTALVLYLNSDNDAFVSEFVRSASVDLLLNGKRIGNFPFDRTNEAMLRFRDCQSEGRIGQDASGGASNYTPPGGSAFPPGGTGLDWGKTPP